MRYQYETCTHCYEEITDFVYDVEIGAPSDKY